MGPDFATVLDEIQTYLFFFLVNNTYEIVLYYIACHPKNITEKI